MQYRLIKSEPYKYSWTDFLKDKKTVRDGVRNYQARNNLRQMKVGDKCLWYHSNEGKEIVGIAEVSKEAYLDPTVETNKEGWVVVEVIPRKSFTIPLSRDILAQDPYLKNMVLFRQQRLSVAPVTKSEYDRIISLSNI